MRSKSPNVEWIQTMKYPRRGTWNATRPIVPLSGTTQCSVFVFASPFVTNST